MVRTTVVKGSKGLETVLEFCDLHGESELSKYLSITYFIYIYLLYLLLAFMYCPDVLTPRSGR